MQKVHSQRRRKTLYFWIRDLYFLLKKLRDDIRRAAELSGKAEEVLTWKKQSGILKRYFGIKEEDIWKLHFEYQLSERQPKKL